ncbi:hypothetical protein [Paraburkholderia silvatlantica]|uniref:hypothetical protein n=1 Tax=Paraburkholderia silvatlantica TaxID=321895 RepID=UPI00375291B4
MLHSLSESIVVLIDLQTRLLPAIHDGESVVAQAVRLGRIARGLDVSVIGTEQNPDAPGENAKEIKDLCSITVAKHHFDATADGLFDVLCSAVDRRGDLADRRGENRHLRVLLQ